MDCEGRAGEFCSARRMHGKPLFDSIRLGVLDSVLTLCDRERQKLSRRGKRKLVNKDIHTFRSETETVLKRTEAHFFESLPQLVAAESFQC